MTYRAQEEFIRGCGKVPVCWEILRFLSDFFFYLLTHSLVIFLLLAQAVNELRMEKDRDTLKLNFYSTGLQLFRSEERFS